MKLSDAIQAFEHDRRAKGYARGTIVNQSRFLRHLLAATGNIETKSLRPQHVDAYWDRLSHLAPGSLNVARGALQSFFKWGQNRGYIRRDIDLLAGMRKFKVPPRNRLIIPQPEFASILESIVNPRTRIAMATGLYVFTRISETSNLRWQDIDLDTGHMEVYRQKTNTMDTLPICVELAEEIRHWRFEYGSMVGETPRPDAFFIPGREPMARVGKKGHWGFTEESLAPMDPMRRPVLGGYIRDELIRVGYYNKHEGGHTLRRSGAIALYNELSRVGHDRAIRICQAMLGHATITTTEIYLRLDLDRKVRNDLLAGKPMFPHTRGEAEVVDLSRQVRVREAE
jgi:integrase